MADLDMITGAVTIRHGKGDKYRVAFVGSTTRKATRAYRKARNTPDGTDPLWVTDEGGRLSPNGLQEILKRIARRAWKCWDEIGPNLLRAESVAHYQKYDEENGHSQS